MTTIATDGKSIAADSLVTHNGNEIAYKDKLWRLADGSIIGGAGSSPDVDEAIRLLANDPDYEGKISHEGDQFELLRLYPSGAVAHYSASMRRLFPFIPFAIGSGADLALGAMMAGKSPKVAVKIAAMRDLKTGGPIDSYKAGA